MVFIAAVSPGPKVGRVYGVFPETPRPTVATGGCGKVRTCRLADLQTDQWVNCGPLKCRPRAIKRLMRDVP